MSVAMEKKLIHYMTKAIHDYDMIAKGDRIMVCLSGGKDSFTLLKVLNQLQKQQQVLMVQLHKDKHFFELKQHQVQQIQMQTHWLLQLQEILYWAVAQLQEIQLL